MAQPKTHNQDSSITTEYAYITRSEGIPGRNAIVTGTRVGVHDVVGLLQNGETIDTIVTQSFPNLTRAQVYECLGTMKTSGAKLTC